MKDDDRYLAAVREECEGLTREQLLRRIAALSRRLDTETTQHHAAYAAYARIWNERREEPHA